jgi:hypothetical protein
VQTERVGAPAPRGIKIRLPLSSEGRVGAMEKGPAAHPRRGPRKTALCFSESKDYSDKVLTRLALGPVPNDVFYPIFLDLLRVGFGLPLSVVALKLD